MDPNLLRTLQQLMAAAQGSGMTPVNTAMNTAMPQVQPPQPSSSPAAADNVMQMMMARAMSVPIATMLFQMMGSVQQPPAQPVFNQSPLFSPVSQSVPAQMPSPVMQPALLQMVQQLVQAGGPSPAAAATPHTSALPSAPLQVNVSPATLPSPGPSASTSPSTSPGIQVSQMDVSAAKGLLVALVQHLQQAGQLPDVQQLLQPNTIDTTKVEVKKEVVQQQASVQNPLCVIAKTEGFNDNAGAEVYMDRATDSADDVEGGARVRKSSQSPAVAQGKQRVSRPKSSSSSRSSSSAGNADPKLQRKCIVQLNKVAESAERSVSIPAPLSRVDKLKSLKKHVHVSTDILQTNVTASAASTESQQPVAATTAATASTANTGSNKLADHKPVLLQNTIPLTVPSATSSTRTGPRNIFSIFSQHSTGRGMQQLEEQQPMLEERPSDPLPPSVGLLLQRSVNSAANSIVSLRSMYLGYVSHNMEWLSLISSIFDEGHKKTFCQCTFCPKLGELPRDVAVHISNDHPDLLFALNKLKPVVGPMVYIKCRHCNFVTVESTLAWIHFDIHHGISDILDCSDRAPDIDLSGPNMPEKFIGIDEVMGSSAAYICFDCSAVNAEPDTRASAMLMARHVACQHPDSINCNGNFVKLMLLTRTEGDPDSIKGSPTYRQAITEDQHIRGRREVYICMFCRYSAFSPYLALSHSISAHQTKKMLFICNNGTCDYQCLAEVDMVQHMRVEHADYGNTIPLVCTSTLVEKKSSGVGHVECPVLVKRTGAVEFVTSSWVKSKMGKTPVSAKRSMHPVSVSSSEDDEESEEEEIEVPPKKHNLRRSVNTKGTKIQKVGGENAGGRETRQTSKAKPARKRAKIEDESEEELQSTTVTSTNDRSGVTATASATVMNEESTDEQTQDLEIDAEVNNSRSEVITAPEKEEEAGDSADVLPTADNTEADETGDQAEQLQEDEETDRSNVITASEQEEEMGDSSLITTAEPTTEDETADEVDTGSGNDQSAAVTTADESGDQAEQLQEDEETDRLNVITASEQEEEMGDSSLITTAEPTTEDETADEVDTGSGNDQSAAMTTADESVTTGQVEATDDETDNRGMDTDSVSDQVSAMSHAETSETEADNLGIESEVAQSADEGTTAAVDSPSSPKTTASATN